MYIYIYIHTYIQVLGMPRINAIVRTEALERDWARLLDTLGVPTERRVRVSTTNVAGKLLDAEDIKVLNLYYNCN